MLQVDQVKKKHALLHIVKKLTDGIVSGNVNWSTVKAPLKKTRVAFTEKRKSENKQTDSVDSGAELYSTAESCSILQSSYDDLYIDDDEAIAAETEVNVAGDDVLLETSSDSVDDSINQPFVPNSDALVVDVENEGDRTESDDDINERFAMEDKTDLYTPEVWDSYYRRLREIGHTMKDREGWPKFDAVFMISAIDGDGVSDIKVSQFFLVLLLHHFGGERSTTTLRPYSTCSSEHLFYINGRYKKFEMGKC